MYQVAGQGGLCVKIFETSIEIAAPESRIWEVLTKQVQEDPQPFGITRLEGKMQLGARLKLWSEIDPKRAFSLRVTVFDEPTTMIWKGGMPFGLFTGTRTFSLAPSPKGSQFQMREVFDGLLSGMIVKSIPDLSPSFEKFAQELKRKAESNE